MKALTPGQAWEGYVGSQTPQEFMEISTQKGYPDVTEACIAYVHDSPDIFGGITDDNELTDIACLLARYINETLTA